MWREMGNFAVEMTHQGKYILQRWLLILIAVILVGATADGRRRTPRHRHKPLPDPATIPSVVIDKRTMRLSLLSPAGDTIMITGVATGMRPGQKMMPGDMRTPNGRFSVVKVVDSSKWKHDFGDGLGAIKGTYGPRFVRLLTPGHSGIGIHGTHLPASIGTRASEGCIRVDNDSLLRLVKYLQPGTAVTVIPALADTLADLYDRTDIYIEP